MMCDEYADNQRRKSQVWPLQNTLLILCPVSYTAQYVHQEIHILPCVCSVVHSLLRTSSPRPWLRSKAKPCIHLFIEKRAKKYIPMHLLQACFPLGGVWTSLKVTKGCFVTFATCASSKTQNQIQQTNTGPRTINHAAYSYCSMYVQSAMTTAVHFSLHSLKT